MVDTREIRELLAQKDSRRAIKKLDEIADSIRYSGEHLSGENGADRDEVIAKLSSRGSGSFYEYMYG